jgi:hypothetical protein
MGRPCHNFLAPPLSSLEHSRSDCHSPPRPKRTEGRTDGEARWPGAVLAELRPNCVVAYARVGTWRRSHAPCNRRYAVSRPPSGRCARAAPGAERCAVVGRNVMTCKASSSGLAVVDVVVDAVRVSSAECEIAIPSRLGDLVARGAGAMRQPAVSVRSGRWIDALGVTSPARSLAQRSGSRSP